MHSSLVRIQNAFGFFTTVAFVVAALIAATDLLAPRTPSVGVLKPTNVQVYVQCTMQSNTSHTPPAPPLPPPPSCVIAIPDNERAKEQN